MNDQQNEERFALITVSHRRGILLFAQKIQKIGFKIVASLRTAKYLRKRGIEVIDVENLTGYPVIIGRQGIKLIHPVIFGGILADPNEQSHKNDINKFNIKPFEIVVCNFYPFETSVSKKKVNHAEVLYNLDIGGPAMVRCAAKNYKNVTIITDPNDYSIVLKELEIKGKTNQKTRERLALKAFLFTKEYDEAILNYLLKIF